MASVLIPLIEDLFAGMRSGRLNEFQGLLGRVWQAAQRQEPAELTRGIERLSVELPGLGGVFAKVAVLAGALVERGGSALPLAATLPSRAATALELSAQFVSVWPTVAGGADLPDPGNRPGMRDLIKTLTADGYAEQEATALVMAWCEVEDWLKASITALMRREFRDAMDSQDRERLRLAARAYSDESQRAYWVHGLASVLDNAPLIALDAETRRGYTLTMSGVGDNFQLHVLLADRLIGPSRRGLLPGKPPKPEWVRAATDGPTRTAKVADAPARSFRLFDGHGRYVVPDGWPSDIQPTDGARIVVLYPPNGNYMRLEGRIFVQLMPTLTLDEILDADAAASWFARTVPAVQDDLMAPPRFS